MEPETYQAPRDRMVDASLIERAYAALAAKIGPDNDAYAELRNLRAALAANGMEVQS